MSPNVAECCMLFWGGCVAIETRARGFAIAAEVECCCREPTPLLRLLIILIEITLLSFNLWFPWVLLKPGCNSLPCSFSLSFPPSFFIHFPSFSFLFFVSTLPVLFFSFCFIFQNFLSDFLSFLLGPDFYLLFFFDVFFLPSFSHLSFLYFFSSFLLACALRQKMHVEDRTRQKVSRKRE